MPPAPPVQLHLVRHAETAWREVIAPWLEAGRGRLLRSALVVPTGGQTQALKQRCVAENRALFGVEFLTPGNARKKVLLAHSAATKPVLGREFLLLGLRALIEEKLVALAPEAEGWGFWKSLQSDPEQALDDFDELLRGGFSPDALPAGAWRDAMCALTAWVRAKGAEFSAEQSIGFGLRAPGRDEPPLADRVLVHGFGPEGWGEFFNVLTLVRRAREITVVLPTPEFRGQRGLDERWVELWQTVLGVEAESLVSDEPVDSSEALLGLWQDSGAATTWPERPPQVWIGQTARDEAELVVRGIERALASEGRSLLAGECDSANEESEAAAENKNDAASRQRLVACKQAPTFRSDFSLAVILPTPGAFYLELVQKLSTRGIAFVDQLARLGTPSVETRLQAALLRFYERSARVDEFLAAWPLLSAHGRSAVALGRVRTLAEQSFDDTQSHALDVNLARWEMRSAVEAREVAEVARELLPAWPDTLTLADALARFDAVCEKLGLPLPEGWAALVEFSRQETAPLQRRVVVETLQSFLPLEVSATSSQAQRAWARVTLTSWRRAGGVAWSWVFFPQANAGVWPRRTESSGWLPDPTREELNQNGRFSLGLFTAEDKAWLERRGLAQLVIDAREGVAFSATAQDEGEQRLTPNAWLERVIWRDPSGDAVRDGLEKTFARRAQRVESATLHAARPQGAALQEWIEIWRGRRDEARAFDEYFLSVDPTVKKPDQLAARLIERAVSDPAELWFEAILQAKRVGWEPLVRVRRRTLGLLVHRVVASVWSTGAGRMFGQMPTREEAQERLNAELARARAETGHAEAGVDLYWDSFFAELEQMCAELVAQVFAWVEAQGGERWVAPELWLPAEACVPLGDDGATLKIKGRIDFVILDRPGWVGARVDVIDFKTGGDAKLSVARMASHGDSLQLGLYLAAARSLGATNGRVWMVKPQGGFDEGLGMEDLPEALAALAQLGRHLETGRYGALTADRSEFTHAGFEWPLACAPIARAVLEKKFAATFGVAIEGEEVGDE